MLVGVGGGRSANGGAGGVSGGGAGVSGGGGPVARARARGDVTLSCEAHGRPAPTVSWLKDGDPLTPNEHDIALLDGFVFIFYWNFILFNNVT